MTCKYILITNACILRNVMLFGFFFKYCAKQNKDTNWPLCIYMDVLSSSNPYFECFISFTTTIYEYVLRFTRKRFERCNLCKNDLLVMRRPGRDSSDSLISSHLRPLFGKWFSVWWIIDDSKQYKMVVGVDLIGNTDAIANYNAGMLSVLQEVLPRPNENIIFQMQFKKTVKSWIPMLYFPRKPQTNSFFNFLLSSPVLPLQGCRTWSEIPRVSRQLEQHKNVKASKCNWESTKPCQGVRRAEKPMNIVMKKTSENKPDGFFLFKRSSGLMRVQFHNYGKSTQADGEKLQQSTTIHSLKPCSS